MDMDQAVRRERLKDELQAIQWANVAPLANETYEDTLKRRARLSLRESEILRELFAP
jgi:hypothetical protein